MTCCVCGKECGLSYRVIPVDQLARYGLLNLYAHPGRCERTAREKPAQYVGAKAGDSRRKARAQRAGAR